MKAEEIKTIDSLLEGLKEHLTCIPQGTSMYQYFAYLEKLVSQKNPQFLNEYAPLIQRSIADFAGERPFLSVVVRTQGKRPEMLRETMLSLSAQSDMNFEVVLIGHKLDEQQRALVQQICDEQVPAMQERIRLIELQEGNRTKPLNVGFSYARGEYIAVLDDDDMVMDHWVKSFREAAERRPGAVLHAYVMTQEWMRVGASGGAEGLRAVKAPDAMFCEPFDLFRQIRSNRCPLHGLAFPAYAFRELGIIFDESLDTTEDWDFLMRVAFLTGVEDITQPTALYRLWVNAESSNSLHSQEEWRINYVRIQEKIIDTPFVVPPGSTKMVADESLRATPKRHEQFDLAKVTHSKLYLELGEGYSEGKSVTTELSTNGEQFDVSFRIPEKWNAARRIRFDLSENGMYVLQNLTCILRYGDGSTQVRTLRHSETNGICLTDSVMFPGDDPWLIWDVDAKPLEYVRIMGEVSNALPAEALSIVADRLRESSRPGIFKRVLRKVKTMIQGT